MTRQKMFAIWFAIAFGGSATIAFVFADGWTGPYARSLTVLHMMPVLLATLFVQGPVLKQPVLAPLGLRLRINRWWLIAWLSPVLLLALGVLFAWVFFGVDPVLDIDSYLAHKRALMEPANLERFDELVRDNPPSEPIWFWLVVQGLPAGLTINSLVTLSTEVGFRGFLFREVQGGFWRRSLLVGLVEAAWLAPAVAFGLHFPDNPMLGVAAITIFCVAVSPVCVYLRVRADSTIAVSLFRGTLLALTLPATELAFDATDWQRPFYGLAGSAALLVLLALYALHDRRAKQPLLSSGNASSA